MIKSLSLGAPWGEGGEGGGRATALYHRWDKSFPNLCPVHLLRNARRVSQNVSPDHYWLQRYSYVALNHSVPTLFSLSFSFALDPQYQIKETKPSDVLLEMFEQCVFSKKQTHHQVKRHVKKVMKAELTTIHQWRALLIDSAWLMERYIESIVWLNDLGLPELQKTPRQQFFCMRILTCWNRCRL